MSPCGRGGGWIESPNKRIASPHCSSKRSEKNGSQKACPSVMFSKIQQFTLDLQRRDLSIGLGQRNVGNSAFPTNVNHLSKGIVHHAPAGLTHPATVVDFFTIKKKSGCRRGQRVRSPHAAKGSSSPAPSRTHALTRDPTTCHLIHETGGGEIFESKRLF